MARSRWGLLVPMKLVEGILMLFLHVIIISMFFLTVHSQLSLQSSDDYISLAMRKRKSATNALYFVSHFVKYIG